MNKTSILILFLIFNSLLYAQLSADKVRYEVIYETKGLIMPHKGIKANDIKVLQIGDSVSRFYSVWEDEIQKKRDSLKKKGYSPDQSIGMIGGMKRSYDKSYIYKNYPSNNKMTVYDLVVKDFVYEDNIPMAKWNILNDHKTILGYKCQKAKANYRGRNWIVWFAPEIPLSEGPWKLSGLPGLILQADDEKNEYNFICVGIKNVIAPYDLIVDNKKKTIKTTRTEFLKLFRNLYLKPDETLSQIAGVQIKSVTPDTEERSYNPIEF
ncbi:MAG: GLPGLI family protein [Bacteroidales bacterium]